MKRNMEIEAALERSLRAQVNAPQLDRKFDAKVWARIEAEARPVAARVPVSRAVVKAGRWLDVINILSLASAAIFVSFFGARMFAGADISVTLPEFSPTVNADLITQLSLCLAGAAVLFGFWNAPWSRRLRDELF
jgi:hypothetical protein